MIEKYEGYLGVGSGGKKTRFMATVSPKLEVFDVPQMDTTEIDVSHDFVGKTSPIGLGKSGMAGIENVVVKGDRL